MGYLLGFGSLGFLDPGLNGLFATLTLTIQFFLTLMLFVTCHNGLLDISALTGLFFRVSRAS